MFHFITAGIIPSLALCFLASILRADREEFPDADIDAVRTGHGFPDAVMECDTFGSTELTCRLIGYSGEVLGHLPIGKRPLTSGIAKKRKLTRVAKWCQSEITTQRESVIKRGRKHKIRAGL
jgi:hypothetical protein